MLGVLVAAVLALDGGTDAGVRLDAGLRADAGTDAGVRVDAGVKPVDAGVRVVDAGVSKVDAGIVKVVVKDAGVGPFLAVIPSKQPDGGSFGTCRQTPIICFSPEGDCDLLVIALINRAMPSGSLEVSIYSLNRPGIVDAILRAKARKVAVRLIVDSSQIAESREAVQLKRLLDAGIPIKRDTHQGVMHMKIIVRDNQELLTGSFNFTNNASENNDENTVVWDCPKVAFVYKTKFEAMWTKFKDAGEMILKAQADGGS